MKSNKSLNNNEEARTVRVGSKIIERTNALTLIHDSKEYFKYYLKGRPSEKGDVSKVSYFLLMRSLELALKAILKIREGILISKLKTKYGHNVGKLYNYCVLKEYIKSQGKEEQIAIEILSNYYNEKDFEYTKIGSKSLPRLFYISNLINRVFEEFTAASQSKNKQRYL